MYKMFIVDDEQSIRQGIANAIPWQEWGFCITGLYADGAAALEAIYKDPPDVVLSDIRMPKMDGVELMQVLCREFPQIRVIILSGYSDFEYLNMSIRNNVMEYLLKPTDVDEFEKTFRRIREKLDDERQKSAEYDALVQSRHAQWLNALLDGYALEGMDDAPVELEEAYGCHFENCRVLFLAPDHPPADDKALYQLKTALVKLCLPAFHALGGTALLTGEKNIVGLVSRPPEQELSQNDVKECALQLQRTIESALGTTVSIGVSTLCTEVDMLPQGYAQAKGAAAQTALFHENSLLFYRQYTHHLQHQAAQFRLDALKSALLAQSSAGVAAVVDEAFDAFEAAPQSEYSYIDQICTDTLLSLSRWLLQYNIRLEQTLAPLDLHYTDVQRHKRPEEKKAFMLRVVQAIQMELARGRGTKQKTSTAYLVRKCVDKYYTDNAISLEFVADKVGKSPVYISKIFKSQFDCNFSEYLTRRRMEKSRELLENSTLKVYEIAQSVGYADPSSFIKVFRKYYGHSPTTYQATLRLHDMQKGGAPQ